MDADYTVGTTTDGKPVIDLPHGLYGLGCLPKNLSANVNRYPPLASAFPEIPAKDWTEQDFRPYCIAVQDQGQSSACGPFSVKEAMATGFALTGDEKPDLSAWFCYGQTNGGRDQGTALPDLLRAAEETGLPLDKTVRQGNMFGPYPKDAYLEAKRFRIEAAYDSPTFAAICSACERDMTSVIGIDIGAAFTPDAAGYLPPYRSAGQVLGHAISVQGKKYAQGQWWLLIQNHWSLRWGVRGFALLPASYINPYFGAWTLRCLRVDPLDPTPAPAVG